MTVSDLSTFLLFSRRTDLRRISFDTSEKADIVIEVQGLSGAVALDWGRRHRLRVLVGRDARRHQQGALGRDGTRGNKQFVIRLT